MVLTRQLGKNGPTVPAIGLGCMGLSYAYGPVESEQSRIDVLDRAYALGCTFWDSSDLYGDNEDFIGRWFKANPGKRENVFLCTKFALQNDAELGDITIRSDAAYVKEACDKSLKRLGVDKIDLYYCHRVDGKTPIEETMQAMVELKEAGKIDYIGLSEVSAATLRRACKVHHVAAVQVEYSPFALDIEEAGLLDACRELGVSIVAYSPLGRGLLAGKIKKWDDIAESDFRRTVPRFQACFNKIMELTKLLESMAAKKGCTPGQLALAWLLKQDKDLITIPGTKTVKYLEENVGGNNVEVTDADDAEIRKQVEELKIEGKRYPGNLRDASLADTPLPK